MSQQSNGPGGFAYLTKAELWLTGRWQHGGVASVRDGKFAGQVDLPPLLFGVLAVLLMAAKRAASPSKTWAAQGYMTANEIHAQLRHYGVETDIDRIIALVFRLRAKLAELHKSGVQGRQWARQLIESHKRLGYRLSAPPENLHLHIVQFSTDPCVESRPRTA